MLKYRSHSQLTSSMQLPRWSMIANGNHNGFTLLELLITTALSAMVLLLVTSGSSFVMQEWQRESSRLETTQETALTGLRLEQAISGAFPHIYWQIANKKRTAHIFFNGTANTLSWASTVFPGQMEKIAAWHLVQKDDDIVITIVPAGGNNPDDMIEKKEPDLVFTNTKIELQYLEKKVDKTNNKVTMKWVNSWDGKKMGSLPAAVSLTLTSKRDESYTFFIPIQANHHPQVKPKLQA